MYIIYNVLYYFELNVLFGNKEGNRHNLLDNNPAQKHVQSQLGIENTDSIANFKYIQCLG